MNPLRNLTRTLFALSFIIFYLPIEALAAVPAPAEAKDGMVATSQAMATEVGLAVLKSGGNAMDAAVAVGYALAVTDPCCGNIGGGGFMLYRPAQGDPTFINFREKAPLAIKQSSYQNEDGQYQPQRIQQGYLAVAIPGTVKGLNYALDKYGTWSRAKVMAPAIRLAEEGFILQQGNVNLLKRHEKAFQKQPNVAAIFLNAGRPFTVGERLKQPQLAATLKSIAEKGDEVFYQGWIAKRIVAASDDANGVLSLDDFANYTVKEAPPLYCQYRGLQIISAPPPSSGGVTLCQMLAVLESTPLRKSGFHSAAAVHYQAEAMRYAYADRNQFLGDPDFVNNPIKLLLSTNYIKQIRDKILPDQAGDSSQMSVAISNESPQTTHYSIVDAEGNAVAVTYTINGYFGAKVIAGDTGFFLNNEMDDFSLTPDIPNAFGLIQGRSNAIAPGKRPLSSMTPTIVTQNNVVYMVLGAAGGSTIITQVLQAINNVVDFDMNIQQAIDAARIHMQWLPDVIFYEPYALSADTQQVLTEMGYQLQEGSPYHTPYWGVSNAILRDPKQGVLYGASDSRRTGSLAMGYSAS